LDSLIDKELLVLNSGGKLSIANSVLKYYLTLQRYLVLFDKFNSRLRLCER